MKTSYSRLCFKIANFGSDKILHAQLSLMSKNSSPYSIIRTEYSQLNSELQLDRPISKITFNKSKIPIMTRYI